jgi:MoaA/NifB/PqqE/SkfB family radical SAM enzyme
MKNELELVHFQITRNCNLRCWFCGQWGKRGFFREGSGKAMEYAHWLRLAEELAALPRKPDIILWGGEPLVCPDFDRLAGTLHDMGFRLGLVTNGTLLDRHLAACREYFTRIYVSLDGPEGLHDSIRGKGVFRKVAENLRLLRGGKAKISVNTVLTPALLEDLDGALDAFAALQPDEVLLQEMIALDAGEIHAYKTWLEREFSQQGREIDSWLGEIHPDPRRDETITRVIAGRNDPFRVIYKPHGAACGKHCTSALHHAHVTWKGSVSFCTDFYDFSAGNVLEMPLLDILTSETAERYGQEIAAGHNPACDHCSWRAATSFRL